MKFLIIGSGAREQALVKALERSKQNPEIFCCGTGKNPGILPLSKNYWVGDICDTDAIVKKAKDWQIDITIIGPEAPLQKGLADILWKNGIPTIGPTKKLAQIETSKTFTRNLLKKYGIKGSLKYRAFTNLEGVKTFLEELGEKNYVIKADGLMSGKGVKVAGEHLHSLNEALLFCETILSQGQSFVIEEKLIGQEFSLLSFCDGKNLVAMPAVQDHKRLLPFDKGPNTGGMGSYSDSNHRLPFLTEEDLLYAKEINAAVLKALSEECNETYCGFLYGSFMLTKEGVRLIEYNARLGDPEAMNVLAILASDFVTICKALVGQNLSADLIHFAKKATVCKYLVPEGYPDKVKENFVMDFSYLKFPEQLYFGSVDIVKEAVITKGGRAIAILGINDTIYEAEKLVEAEIRAIPGPFFHRFDIGTQKLIEERIHHMQEIRSCVD